MSFKNNKNAFKQIIALFFVYLLLLSPLTVAQQEESEPQDPQQIFLQNPTPENFDQLPNPTAADLEKVQNPTMENFNKLPSSQQGLYLSKEQNYHQEFAERFYVNPSNWELSAEANTVFFKENRLRDFLRKGAEQKNAAEQYFDTSFPASFRFEEIGDNFHYDTISGKLFNGITRVSVSDPTLVSVVATLDKIEPPQHGLKVKFKAHQEVTISGDAEISYDEKEQKIIFTDAVGKKQRFTIPISEQDTALRFEADTLTVVGPVKGMVNLENDFAQFDNHEGTLIIQKNSDISAENAEVITSRLYADGRYQKSGKTIQAWDVGSAGKKTVIVDKNACSDAGACVGVATQGQWDARYLPADQQDQASTLTVTLDTISETSSFYQDPSRSLSENQKTDQLREQAQELRAPQEPALPGKNAKVWINKDKDNGVITVTSKGIVEVGLYDARGDAAAPVQNDFQYHGHTGLSELDLQFGARTQVNVRGQADLKNNEYREGIFTNQDGAVIKITHDDFGLDQKDIIRATCFDCNSGEAVVIQKTVTTATVAAETRFTKLFSEAQQEAVRLTVNVDDNGKIIFAPSATDLGALASRVLEENQEISIGRNLLVSVPCDGKECNFKLTHDPQTGEPGAAYWEFDPSAADTVPPQKAAVNYPLTVKKVVGNELAVVSEQNAENVRKIATLLEEGNFQELSKISFDKNDPGYASLRRELLESGINPDELQNKDYLQQVENIIKSTTEARKTLLQLGIELDERGRPKNLQDQQRMQEIMKKNGGVEFDQLTQAQLILARNKITEVSAQLKGCQQTGSCPVSREELRQAESEAGKIQKQRQGAYERWKTLEAQQEARNKLEEARKRLQEKPEDNGIEDIDRREVVDVSNKIKGGEKERIDLHWVNEMQKNNADSARGAIQAWLNENLKRSQLLGIDAQKFDTDPDYVAQVVADFGGDDVDLQQMYADLKFHSDNKAETQAKIQQLDTDLKDWSSQQEALRTKYIWDGKHDVAAEIARLSEDYELAKAIVQESPLIPEEYKGELVNQYTAEAQQNSLNKVTLLYDYGYAAEASASLEKLETADPTIIETPEYTRAIKAQNAYARRAIEQRESELLEQKRIAQIKIEDERSGAQREYYNAVRNWNAVSIDNAVAHTGEVAGAFFGMLFQDSEEAGAYVLGHAVAGEDVNDLKEELDQAAMREQNRQLEQIQQVKKQINNYDAQGLSAQQALADARSGTAGEQIAIWDEPAAIILEKNLNGAEASREELFDQAARDADNSLRFNRNKMAGEPEAQLRAALALCPDCSGAKVIESNLKELDKNVLPEILGGVLPFDYVGESFGEALGEGILEQIGITYTARTEEQFRDMAIASLDATTAIDIAEVVIGTPIALANAAKKVRGVVKAVDAAEEAIKIGWYASKESRAALKAARAAEKAAETAGQVQEARKAVKIAQEVIEAEVAAGIQASKYQNLKLVLNTPLNSFDREVAGLRNAEVGNIADNVVDLNQARRDLDAAREVSDAVSEGQALARISDAQENIQRSAAKIDELDELARASQLAGSKSRQLWDKTLGRTIGVRQGFKFGSAGEEVVEAERDFRAAAKLFDEAKSKARLVGDSQEAVISRARLNRATETVETAAAKVEDAYLSRKAEIGKSILKEQINVAKVAGSGDEAFDAVGAEGVSKIGTLLEHPAVKLQPQETGFRFEVIKDVPENSPLRIEVEEGNQLLSRIDTSSARAEAEIEQDMLEGLAESEFALAEGVQQRRLEAGPEVPTESGVGFSDVVEPCNVAAAAVYGLATCATRKGMPVAEQPGVSVVRTRTAELLPTIDSRDPVLLQNLEERIETILQDQKYQNLKRQFTEAGIAEEKANQLVVKTAAEDAARDWNDITRIIETHPGARLEARDLETLMIKDDLFIGSGAEGIVLEVPEPVRLAYNLPTESVIKVKHTNKKLEALTNPFPEQAVILNRLADQGVAPRVYLVDDTYYIAEKIEGKTLQEAILERLTPEQRLAYDQAGNVNKEIVVLTEAAGSGQLEDVTVSVEDLADVLMAENIEIADFHWKNIIIVEKEGKLQAKILDAGFAISGDPVTINELYEDKVIAAMTGGGFDIGDFSQEKKLERAETLVSDRVDTCVIAGGAIYGLASCATARELSSIAIPLEKEIEGVPVPEISGIRVKTPEQIAQEISTIKRAYTEQDIDLESIIRNHPAVKVQKAEVRFNNKLGEGTVGIVYEADLPEVGENLAFKTAKATPGELGRIRGTLEDNIDSLFNEFENAQEACQLVPCPEYYGIYEVEGIPYLVSDKIEGRHFFDLTDEEIVQYFTPEKIEIFQEDLARAIDQGWNTNDLQGIVLTKQQKGGAAGDFIFVDLADWERRDLTDAQKQKLFDEYMEDTILSPREGSIKAIEFRQDFPQEAEIIEAANAEEFRVALEAAGYEVSDQALVYLRPGKQQVRRMFEAGVDPLEVSLKIPEAKATIFKTKFTNAATVIENANIDQLGRALEKAGYNKADALFIEKKKERLRRMYELGIDPEKVAAEIPGTYLEPIFEISGKKYTYDPVKGAWVEKREGLTGTLFGDKEITDTIVLSALDQARAQAGLSKAAPLVIQKGDNLFEIAGKEYYVENGVWKEKRGFWFDKEVEDPEIVRELETARAPEVSEAEIVQEAELPPCSVGGAVGQAVAAPCIPETPALWKESLQEPTFIDEIRQEAKSEDMVSIGEEEFIFKDRFGNTVEAVESLEYSKGDSFTIKITDKKTKETIASHDYYIETDPELGEVIYIGFTSVEENYRLAGLNQLLFQHMSDLHPDIDYIDTVLSEENSRLYKQFLENNPSATPLDAIRQTPAYKIRQRTGWEIDLENSNLPTSEELEEMGNKADISESEKIKLIVHRKEVAISG